MTDIPMDAAADIVEFYDIYCRDELDRLRRGDYDTVPVIKVSLKDVQRFHPPLIEDLKREPDIVLNWFQTVIDDYSSFAEEVYYGDEWEYNPDLPTRDLPPDVYTEFTDPPQELYVEIGEPISHLGEFVAIEGICQQVSDPKPRILKTEFECKKCGHTTPVDCSDVFTFDEVQPPQCTNCERQGPFERLKTEESREMYQRVRLQQPPENAQGSGQPREIVCDAQGNYLADRCDSGTRVTLTGVVEEQNDDSTLIDERMAVNGIRAEESGVDEDDIDEEDRERIHELAQRDDLYDLLANRIGVNIYGYDDICLAIALQLFGGVTKEKYGNTKRGQINTMLIGAPGTGKSQLLESAATLAPRSIKAGGSNSTSVGLTASAIKRTIGDDEQWVLEAGALPKADEGVITLDEFDNMRTEEQESLNEALSEGEIKVNKADIRDVRLRTRCSAIIAANPEDGRFDKHRSYYEQFDMPDAILNRCDLVFTFEDSPDEEVDGKVADQIYQSHQAEGGTSAVADGGVAITDENGVLDGDLMTKYIAYARGNVDPSLPGETFEMLKDFYVRFRNDMSDEEENRIAFNARGLEGLIRYAEASARARLSDTVEAEDAQRAIELKVTSMKQAATNDDGAFDVDRLEQGSSGGLSPKQERDRVKNALDEASRKDGSDKENALSLAELVDRTSLSQSTVEHHLRESDSSLLDQGDAYAPGGNQYIGTN